MRSLGNLSRGLILGAALLALQGCEDEREAGNLPAPVTTAAPSTMSVLVGNADGSDAAMVSRTESAPADDAGKMPPRPKVETPAAAPPTMLTPAPRPEAANLPVVELWAAERIADRFRTLHRLVGDDLLDADRYEAWTHENMGAFLLLTVPPPQKGLAAKIPPYDEVSGYLRSIRQDRPDIAAAERAALLGSLMPAGVPHGAAMQPPQKEEQLARWISLLDALSAEGVLPGHAVAAERAALILATATAQ